MTAGSRNLMAVDRSEQVGVGVAAAAHIALIALLSLTWGKAPIALPENPPMSVDLIAEIAPVSTAPVPATEPPAAQRGEVDSDVAEPLPAPPVPRVEPRVVPPPPAPPKAVPAPAPRPAPRAERRPPPTPPRAIPERRSERATPTPPRAATPARTPPRSERTPRPAAGDPLADIASSVARTAPPGARGTNAPAAQTAAQVRQAITVAVDREIAPFWQRNAPSGIEVEQLRLVLEISLNRDGSIAGVRQIGELGGRTDSNAPQQARFVEQAIRSVRQAGPFRLPEEHYDSWRVVRQPFRARLGT